jgi:hypothetical protein
MVIKTNHAWDYSAAQPGASQKLEFVGRIAKVEENIMDKVKQPSKEQVRQYMEQRRAANDPPPSMDEIRRQLGWQLTAMPPMASWKAA